MLKSCFQKNVLECGCDEAGRGCLAGPVYAAAVILPENFKNEELDDSKKLHKKKRKELRKIIENEAIAYAVVAVDNEKIDQINILNASFLAMTKAVRQLMPRPEFLLIDGNMFRTDLTTPYRCIVKGDSEYLSIAAASILAKTYRDEYMEKLDAFHPLYGWERNKGYPTIHHRKAISVHGVTKFHRKSFRLFSIPK